jgi:hypothetical protein
MVAAHPVPWTPHVLDGEVRAIVQVGDRVVAGGSFHQVEEATGQAPVERRKIFAFDARTGAIDQRFTPAVDGRVEALAASADGRFVFVGGFFSTVNGRSSVALAKLDVTNGQPAPEFTAVITGTAVWDLLITGTRLFLAGTFTRINGESRSGVAAVDATTGAVDPDVDLPFTDPRRGVLKVDKLAVDANGSKLVAVGSFTKVAGQIRPQIAVIDLAAKPARLVDWETDRYQTVCSPAYETDLRGVDISPDGAYFVVVTTGPFHPHTLCDSAARWELAARGAHLEPTWVDPAGGDSLTSVAVTGVAVYVGGHQRWMNNPWPRQTGLVGVPGPGAVPRQGIAALDPANGLPLSWNPGRDRGVGVFALLATSDGLWLGSDTRRLAGERHERIGMFPLAGGAAVPPAVPGALPGDLYILGTDGHLIRRAFDGVAAGPPADVGGGVDWSRARGAFMLSGNLYTGWDDGRLDVRTFDGTSFGPARPLDLHGLTSSDFPVASLTGMFFDGGRLYYSVAGDRRLFFRYFTAESGVVGAETFVASGEGDGLDWSGVRGLTMAAGRMYLADAAGRLSRVDFAGGRPVAGTTASAGTSGWTSQGMFVFSA